ncbi:MAG: NAD-dependent epimerase/dehydratase family protein [Flavobacteriales bacterium]
MKEELRGKKVLLTGATGFVGTRLAEILITEYECKVTAAVRNYGKAMRLARYPVTFVYADFSAQTNYDKLVAGIDIVFHCAYGSSGSSDDRQHVDVDGTRSLVEAAAKAGIKSFVFLSTFAVYGTQHHETISETTTQLTINNSYAANKILAQKLVISFNGKNNMRTIVFQPTAVYGPFSPSYGTRIFTQLEKQIVAMINEGNGICNLIYIDDLCKLMIQGAMHPKAAGNIYIATANDKITYADFYRAFSKICNQGEFYSVSLDEAVASAKKHYHVPGFLENLGHALLFRKKGIKGLLGYSFFKWPAKLLIKILPKNTQVKLKNRFFPVHKATTAAAVKRKQIPEEETARFLAMTAIASNQKARNELHFEPAFDFTKGMKEIQKWYNWAYRSAT